MHVIVVGCGRVGAAVARELVDGGHDVLAAYADGSVRYLNHAGGATVATGRPYGGGRSESDGTARAVGTTTPGAPRKSIIGCTTGSRTASGALPAANALATG